MILCKRTALALSRAQINKFSAVEVSGDLSALPSSTENGGMFVSSLLAKVLD